MEKNERASCFIIIFVLLTRTWIYFAGVYVARNLPYIRHLCAIQLNAFTFILSAGVRLTKK